MKIRFEGKRTGENRNRKTRGHRGGKLLAAAAMLLLLILLLVTLCACGNAAESANSSDSAGSSDSADVSEGNSGANLESAPAAAGSEQPMTRIIVAADPHLLATQLMEDPDKVRAACEASDGKLTECSPQIIDRFCEQVISEKPDALVIAGDLTFNGEIVSLRELARKLKRVEKAGVPVLVIPGNHDINNRLACSYTNGKITPARPVSWTDFKLVMERFGYAGGCSRDIESFSYACDLGENLRLIFLDANGDQRSGHTIGSLSEGVTAWLEEQLKQAESSGRTVITVSHQNLLPQNSFLSEGYVLDDHEKIAALLKKYGVRCHLSGHSHLQHEAEDGEIRDICTGVLTGCTLNYGELLVGPDGSCRYEVRHVEDGELQKQALARFQFCAEEQVRGLLAQYDSFTKEERAQMTDLAVRMNTDYFSGSMTLLKIMEYQKDPAMKLWMGGVLKDDLWTQYIQSMLH